MTKKPLIINIIYISCFARVCIWFYMEDEGLQSSSTLVFHTYLVDNVYGCL